MGAKIAKRYNSRKSFLNFLKLVLNFFLIYAIVRFLPCSAQFYNVLSGYLSLSLMSDDSPCSYPWWLDDFGPTKALNPRNDTQTPHCQVSKHKFVVSLILVNPFVWLAVISLIHSFLAGKVLLCGFIPLNSSLCYHFYVLKLYLWSVTSTWYTCLQPCFYSSSSLLCHKWQHCNFNQNWILRGRTI